MFNWNAIAVQTTLLFSAAAILVFSPVLSQRIRIAEEARLESILADADEIQLGLKPCGDEPFGDYYRDVDGLIDSVLPDSPSLSITVFPAFEAEFGVRIVGDRVYFVTLNSSLWYSATDPAMSGRARPTARVKSSNSLSSRTAIRVREHFSHAVTTAEPHDWGAADGISYRVSLPSGACGRVSSPPPHTVAGKLASITHALAKHAGVNGSVASDRSDFAVFLLAKEPKTR